jgi:hypothetical protein
LWTSIAAPRIFSVSSSYRSFDTAAASDISIS